MTDQEIRAISLLPKDEFEYSLDQVVKKSIKCKECGKNLPNLALLNDYDEGFECDTCGICYDAYGKEL